MEILGRGVYNLSEAATLTRLRSQRVREWFLGGTGSRVFSPVFESDYPSLGGSHSISFLDLIEVYIVGRLRSLKIPLQHIRKVYNCLAEEYGKHPLATRQIFVSEVDKKKIFTRGLGDVESRLVIEAMSKQPYFEQIIAPFLKKIDYDAAINFARRWHIAEGVVVDPAIAFGKPTVETTGITTRVLADFYLANGQNAGTVSKWYRVNEKLVRDAMAFESGLAA